MNPWGWVQKNNLNKQENGMLYTILHLLVSTWKKQTVKNILFPYCSSSPIDLGLKNILPIFAPPPNTPAPTIIHCDCTAYIKDSLQFL